MEIVTAPAEATASNCNTINIFLAGSIEMGKAKPWQKDIIDRLTAQYGDKDINVFNPRRETWTALEQTNLQNQIIWELSHIEQSEIVFFFLDEQTISPISLLELGLCLGGIQKVDLASVIVVGEEGYFRQTNVETTTVQRYAASHECAVMCSSLDDGWKHLASRIDMILNY